MLSPLSKKSLLTLLVIALGLLSACTSQPEGHPNHVQCVFQGEVVFDQVFDRAETLDNGTVRVWIGEQSADMEGECKIMS